MSLVYKILLMLYSFSSLAFCQTQENDSLKYEGKPINFERPKITWQFVTGSAIYAVTFWGLGGKRYIETGEVTDAQGVFLGFLLSGAGVTLEGNLDCNCSGSYWAGIGGAYIGGVFGGALYRYVADHNPNNYLFPYLDTVVTNGYSFHPSLPAYFR